MEEQPAEITVEFGDFIKIKNEVVNEQVEETNDDVEPMPAPKKKSS